MVEHNQANESYAQYMQRVGKESIPCYEPSMNGNELKYVTDVIKRNWLSEGKYTREFEKQLAKICGRTHAVAFANATAALIAGMKSAGLKKGDEVIVPSFTHPADPNAITNAGPTPIFADVDEHTLCLSVKTIEAARTEKTKAISFVAVYGTAGGLDEVAAYAKQNNLLLINDCAPALFGTHRGKPIASYGDFSVLSFFADKTITTGEGGMLLSDNAQLIEEANIYKHDGRKERGVDIIERKGFNFRITELQTAIGVAQLEQAPGFVEKKLKNLETYKKHLAGILGVSLFSYADGIVPHRIIIFVPDAQPLITHLSAKGIGVRTMFMPMHSQPCYGVKKELPATEKIFRTGVCLPSAPTLTENNIQFICSEIRQFYGEAK
jgi:perosamine synthetase